MAALTRGRMCFLRDDDRCRRLHSGCIEARGCWDAVVGLAKLRIVWSSGFEKGVGHWTVVTSGRLKAWMIAFPRVLKYFLQVLMGLLHFNALRGCNGGLVGDGIAVL